MKNELTERVGFDFIRYANCWEDADLLVQALAITPEDRILSIASAGDNSFALLAQNPAQLVAVDVNPVQLYLCKLKKAAFTLPDHASFLAFLGFTESSKRDEMYAQIRSQMSPAAQEWFDLRPEIIRGGVIHSGKFENYFSFFRRRLLPLIHSRKDIRKLFAPKTAEAQHAFYHKEWNTWRWRLFFRIFFSKYIMGKYGRDPEFMREVKITVSKYIFEKAEKHLCKKEAQENLYLQHILTGKFEPRLPYYARAEHFETIRKNLGRLILFEGYAEDAIRRHGPFSAFNLSNIFEYLSPEITKKVAGDLLTGSSAGARFAYWNLMVPRKLSAIFPEQIGGNTAASDQFTEADNGFFYHRFNLDVKK